MRYNAEFSQHLFSTFFFSTELFLKILQESPLLTKNVGSVASANYHGHRSSSHVTLIPASNTQYWKKLTEGKDEVIRVSEMCYSSIKQLEREIPCNVCGLLQLKTITAIICFLCVRYSLQWFTYIASLNTTILGLLYTWVHLNVSFLLQCLFVRKDRISVQKWLWQLIEPDRIELSLLKDLFLNCMTLT